MARKIDWINSFNNLNPDSQLEITETMLNALKKNEKMLS